MINKITIFFLGMMIFVGLGFTANAEIEMDTEIISGIVNEVSGSSITIIDSDEEVKVTLKINGKTAFENIQSIKEIAAGDEVYIDYTSTDQGNVAVNIYKMNQNIEKFDEQNFEELGTLEETFDGEEEK